jgi:hypothetical protein
MTYLCLKGPPGNNVPSKEWREGFSTTGSLSIVQTVLSNSGQDTVVLPTFTCRLAMDDVKVRIRGLKDGGCQRNFITKRCAEHYGLSVVEKQISLTVHGFNSSKNVLTSIVRVPLLFGEKFVTINAICIPSIRIKIRVSKLDEVSSLFLNKGYTLADELLVGSNLELIT